MIADPILNSFYYVKQAFAFNICSCIELLLHLFTAAGSMLYFCFGSFWSMVLAYYGSQNSFQRCEYSLVSILLDAIEQYDLYSILLQGIVHNVCLFCVPGIVSSSVCVCIHEKPEAKNSTHEINFQR